MIESLIIAILPGLVDLIKNATSDTYDKEAELQAVLRIQRAIADERARKLFLDPG